jgi:L-asparaginase II
MRSGVEESVHHGDVAVCDSTGHLIAWAGDPERRAFGRSSLKPVQAAVSLEAIGEDLPDAELAVMCGSHTGEPVHVEAAARVLERAGLDFGALRLPSEWPFDRETVVPEPRPEYHNCSGKHAGMVLASARKGWDLETYPRPDHPLQTRIRRAVLKLAGSGDAQVGVDGCGLPVYALSLTQLATMFARAVRPMEASPVYRELTRVYQAMLAEPYLVGGRGRVATAVMQACRSVVVKGGAEGLMCAGALDPGLGIAVKVRDGAARASGPALIRVLHLLDLIDTADVNRIRAHAEPPVLGGGRPVGSLIADFPLKGR